MNFDFKEWTILIYANGNNEMEQEIYDSMIKLDTINKNENINIIMEIGRAKKDVVKIITPTKKLKPFLDCWNGVRRYKFENGSALLIENLNNLNMADGNTLYEFIKWGISNFHAKHYMLLISGHGISFIGGLTDIALDGFYIMGIPTMCHAINLIKEDMGISIDILILDMCYMNLIEILYELGSTKTHTCSNLITYFNEGPLQGIPLDKLINYFIINPLAIDINIFIKNLLDYLRLSLTAYNLNYEFLNNLKMHFNELGYSLYTSGVSLQKVDTIFNSDIPSEYHEDIMNINKILSLIHIYSFKCNYKSSIQVISNNIGKSINLYAKLKFSKYNYWTKLLSNYTFLALDDSIISLASIQLSQIAMFNFISKLNPTFSREQIFDILTSLVAYHEENKKLLTTQ